MFFNRRDSLAEWVVAGLGNPGKRYLNTRHNAGFEALDVTAAAFGIKVQRLKFDALCGSGTADGRRVLLLKPQTFMNLSGQSLIKAVDYYKISPERVIVMCDDVNLAPGVLRIRTGGSDGGHNGLKSLITFLGQDFMRIRIGVGERPHPEYRLADWVTGRPSEAEHRLIAARYPDAAAAAGLLMAGNAEKAMALYNGTGRR